jgi:membrane protein implicated in regulation of membrane protease activity
MLDQTAKLEPSRRRINWINVSTVLSAAILIAAEVFGAAFAGGWAFGNLFSLGEYGTYILQVVFFVIGIVVMVAFIRRGMKIEPFVTRG